jgi:methylthioribulose-1-phosphate dehydratase
MNPTNYPGQAAALCEICRLFGERQWCLATGGNFSVRIDAEHYLITQSGKDKSRLVPEDLMICDTSGRASNLDLVPSAEAALHAFLYRSDADVGAVLHTHSVMSTVASRAAPAEMLIEGFEMQKALRDVYTHDIAISIPVLENAQNMQELCAQLGAVQATGDRLVPGFLVRGHGLYAWGNTLDEAQRHAEGLEFLIECTWREQNT